MKRPTNPVVETRFYKANDLNPLMNIEKKRMLNICEDNGNIEKNQKTQDDSVSSPLAKF